MAFWLPMRAAQRARSALTALGRSVLLPAVDFLYSPACFLCEDPLDPADAAVCSRCWGAFAPVEANDPAWEELLSRVREGGIIDGITACWLLEPEGLLKEAVHLLKYRKVRSLGMRMGEALGTRISRDPLFASADLLVPVPLHRTRLRERGYNQSELLCHGIARSSGIHPAPEILQRTKYTESQTHLDLSVRKSNVADAFRLDPARRIECAGKRIILVDDVMTTGSTLIACAERLRAAGARSVLAACVALAR